MKIENKTEKQIVDFMLNHEIGAIFNDYIFFDFHKYSGIVKGILEIDKKEKIKNVLFVDSLIMLSANLAGFLRGIVNMKFELDSECDFLLRIMGDQINEF